MDSPLKSDGSVLIIHILRRNCWRLILCESLALSSTMASKASLEENNMPWKNVKEVFNDSRHEHNLCLFEGQERYKCSGCKAIGANRGFKCPSCPEFMLHEPCAQSPDQYVHPFFPQQPLKFRAKTLGRHHCDACGEVLLGFMFQSDGGNLKLHPLCMTLPSTLSLGGHKDHSLKLFVQGGDYKCIECKKENKNWKYKCESTTCKVNLDMNCAIVDLHGMSEHGMNLVQTPSKRKGVMKKVFGGVASVGEGVGYGVAYEAMEAI